MNRTEWDAMMERGRVWLGEMMAANARSRGTHGHGGGGRAARRRGERKIRRRAWFARAVGQHVRRFYGDRARRLARDGFVDLMLYGIAAFDAETGERVSPEKLIGGAP